MEEKNHYTLHIHQKYVSVMWQRKINRLKRQAGDALDKGNMQSFWNKVDKLQQEFQKAGVEYDTQTELFMAQRDQLREDIVSDQVNKLTAKSKGYVEVKRRKAKRETYSEFDKWYSTNRSKNRSPQSYSTRRRQKAKDERTGKDHLRNWISKADRMSSRGKGIASGAMGIGWLLLWGLAIWKWISLASNLISGDTEKAKKNAWALALFWWGWFLMNGVKLGKAWQSLGGKSFDEVVAEDNNRIGNTSKAKEREEQYTQPKFLAAKLWWVPLSVMQKHMTFKPNGEVKNIDHKALEKELWERGETGQALAVQAAFETSSCKRKMIKAMATLWITQAAIESAIQSGDTKKDTVAWYYAKNKDKIEKAGKIGEETEKFEDPHNYSAKLSSLKASKETKEWLISEVNKIWIKTASKVDLSVVDGKVLMQQWWNSVLLDIDGYAKSYTTIINGEKYPSHKEINDVRDLVRRAQHEMWVINEFKNKKTHSAKPFYTSGDGIMFDQAPFERLSWSSYFNRDALTVYGDGILSWYFASHTKINALDNDNNLNYYRDRLNSLPWNNKVEANPEQLDTQNVAFVSAILTWIENIKEKIDGISVNKEWVSVFTINGVQQSIEQTRELIKQGNPGAWTGALAGKTFKFIENTAVDVVSWSAIALGNNLKSMYEAASEELSDSYTLNLAKKLLVKSGEKAENIKSATIKGGKLVYTTVVDGTTQTVEKVRDGKIWYALGYGAIEWAQFVGNGLWTIVSEGSWFVVRSTKEFFGGIVDARNN